MALYSDELAKTALARSEAREAIVAEVATRYWFYPASAAEAQTLIFIHGYRGNHHGLEAIAGALPDFNIVIPDLPGFGASAPFAGEHSVEAYVGWLNALVAHVVAEQQLAPWSDETAHLEEIGLLERLEGHFRLTRRGKMLADAVGERFM